jgi:hypothetical protein
MTPSLLKKPLPDTATTWPWVPASGVSAATDGVPGAVLGGAVLDDAVLDDAPRDGVDEPEADGLVGAAVAPEGTGEGGVDRLRRVAREPSVEVR